MRLDLATVEYLAELGDASADTALQSYKRNLPHLPQTGMMHNFGIRSGRICWFYITRKR